MTIVAYASGAQNLPNEAPPASYTEASDPVIELANDNLPIDVNLYGNAVDSNDANAVFTYSWSILSQTHQSPQVILSGNGAVQNPTLEQVNTWGNIRCFLVVTNQNTGETSQTDPLRAPDSAFVTVRVKSAAAVIQKIASGERNWHNDADDWAQAIEDLASGNQGLPPHTITDHTDVVDATGEDLEVLTGGGYANDPDVGSPNPNGALHIHHGDQVDEATRNTRGTVNIETAAGPATAINVERIVLTSSIMFVLLRNGEVIPKIAPLDFRGNNAGGVNRVTSSNLATWLPPSGTTIQEFHVSFIDGGTKDPLQNGGQYLFDLVIGSQADFEADAMQRVNINLTGAPAVDNGPLFLSQNNIGFPIGQKILGLKCISGPVKAANTLGAGLTVTVVLTREAA
jgi:hypothetical protein